MQHVTSFRGRARKKIPDPLIADVLRQFSQESLYRDGDALEEVIAADIVETIKQAVQPFGLCRYHCGRKRHFTVEYFVNCGLEFSYPLSGRINALAAVVQFVAQITQDFRITVGRYK